MKTRKDYRPRVFAQVVDEVGRAIYKAFKEERKLDKGLTQAALAKAINKDPAFVNRVLTGGKNMELKTVADILGALGYEMKVSTKRIEPMPNPSKNEGSVTSTKSIRATSRTIPSRFEVLEHV
ncbi:helix-turn-helix domain-containing protein [Gluconobacter cerinus]|uniref:helix-turn-helix domain-containing protein n=1 Tax=Gluconobacter cerinus TaxID=38307 RepID=UPI001B8BC36E|nr:helix-turn-helix transcriptional regulator [Gluconobacter cerinus]MBS1026138.1 helix-turn-helix transcriptional regulator [Gluconobacter cerinus]MBS1044569.1 helix-turn-helix transcriptional regulator [Gluconobacter cerinus]